MFEMEKSNGGRGREWARLWYWPMVAAVLILLAALQSFSYPSLHPHTLAALSSTFARAPQKLLVLPVKGKGLLWLLQH